MSYNFIIVKWYEIVYNSCFDMPDGDARGAVDFLSFQTLEPVQKPFSAV
jgi:hypothetical protein